MMQSGGQAAICDSCGMQYSVERMREKVQEIKGVVSVEGTVRTQDADFIIRGGVLERYNGNDAHVVVPNSVVKIGENAFEGCIGIQSVQLPPGLIEIGVYSFYGCQSLKQITVPDSVEVIGNRAFAGCIRLEKINIPAKVKDWRHKGVFNNCSAFLEICEE